MLKKFNFTVVFLLFFGAISAQNNRMRVISSSENEMIITFTLNDYRFKTVITPHGDALVPIAENASYLLQKGAPDVPKITKSVIVPDMGASRIEMLDSKFTTFENVLVAPSKGNFTRDRKPSEIPYEFGKQYETDQDFPGKLAGMGTPYIVRDYRGQTVDIYPFQYNPKTKSLKVYSEITVKISFERVKGTNELLRTQNLASVEKQFSEIYKSHFLNFDEKSRYTPTEESGNMLIICNDAWMSAMQPFVDWKNTIGRPTVMVSKTTAGANAAAIKTYVQNYYNTNGLTYLLLVGDAAQVPTNSGGGLGGDSDNAYAYVTGSDSYQEFFVGRFSAENEAHVATQVLRTIEYEKGDQLADGFLNRAMGIASAEGDGQGDDGEADYTHARNMLTDMLGYTYDTPSYEIFDGSQGGNDASGNATAAQVAAALNAGAGVITYTGHGSDTYWVSSGFDVDDVNVLTNNNKLPFIFDVACVNGNFVGMTCFGEAWMRAENGGEPTGAIAICASTINQSWSPPMAAQDEMVDILIESYQNNIKRTFTGIVVNGMFLMNDEYQDYAMTDTWTTFGDPSVMVRTDNPDEMSVTHNAEHIFGQSTFSFSCDFDGAFACLSKDGAIIGTATVAGGTASIQVSGVNPGETMTLAVTGFNKVTYLQDITVISPEGAYIVLDSYSINGLMTIDYGQSGNIDITLINVGPDNATNISVTMSTTDIYITSLTINESIGFGTIAGNDGTATSSGKFHIEVADYVPYGYTAQFDVTITDGTDTWTAMLNLPIDAPQLTVGNILINDGAEGILDPGETADIVITMTNTGNADISNILTYLSSISSDLVLNTSETSAIALASGVTESFTFNISADMSTAPGTPATLTFDATGGDFDQYSASKDFEIIIGFVPEYCESGAEYDGDSMIDAFSFGNVTNNTSADCATYSDFTEDESLTDVFIIGTSFNFSLSLGTCGGNYTKMAKIFIDWNYDGDFNDADETVYTSTTAAADLTFTGIISIPISALSGPKFMRIVSIETTDASDISPCGTYSYGETEDYKLYLITPVAPVADFTASATTVTVSENVQFTDLSTNYPSEWIWTISGTENIDYEYNNGTSSNSKHPKVKFLNTGVYTVSLEVENLSGSSSVTKTDYITVNPISTPPVADFSANTTLIPSGNFIVFTDLSTNLPTAWAWEISPSSGVNFVNGSTQSSQNPEIQFSISGSYTISLVSSNEFGDSETEIKTNYIIVTDELVIGEGTIETINYPFYNYFENNKSQMIYLSNELGAAKQLTSLSFDFSDVTNVIADRTMSNLSIKMMHTSQSSGTAYLPNTSAEEVFFADTYTLPGTTGWQTFELSGFEYNGTDNLMIEVVWGDNGFYTGGDDFYKVHASAVATGSVIYGFADYETPPNMDGTSSSRPNIKLAFEPGTIDNQRVISGSFKVYPNPSKGLFAVETLSDVAEISIYNLNGQLIFKTFTDSKLTNVDLSNQSAGVYLVKISDVSNSYTQKLIIR